MLIGSFSHISTGTGRNQSYNSEGPIEPHGSSGSTQPIAKVSACNRITSLIELEAA